MVSSMGQIDRRPFVLSVEGNVALRQNVRRCTRDTTVCLNAFVLAPYAVRRARTRVHTMWQVPELGPSLRAELCLGLVLGQKLGFSTWWGGPRIVLPRNKFHLWSIPCHVKVIYNKNYKLFKFLSLFFLSSSYGYTRTCIQVSHKRNIINQTIIKH